ncbi:MAG: TetR/AcrR family transcriptional regulator [Nitrospinae bacterium]|nr:TetR/AcrR family transcriptional regulator [Nitrospinota bacterium]
MKPFEDVKRQILESAEKRFSDFGFNKTTLAEIAHDCKMSQANIYRYFKNKLDIAAFLTEWYFEHSHNRLRAIVRESGPGASQKLERFVVDYLRFNHTEVAKRSRIFDMVEYICRERRDIIEKNIATERALIAEILSEGNRNGEFNVKDVVATSGYIQSATLAFNALPFFLTFTRIGDYPLAEMEESARGVVRTLIKGLK